MKRFLFFLKLSQPPLGIALVATLMTVVLYACTTESNKGIKAYPPSHLLWDTLVGKHVSESGFVDYKGFLSDSTDLNHYLKVLRTHPPDKATWSRQQQLAYWINAYNAFTIKLIIDNYPVSSIRELHPALYVPLINTVWHIEFFKIGNEKFNLDRIEHAILRKEFREPRIHFAIVCASRSCPPLRPEAYQPDQIERQLEDQARLFINDSVRNKITGQPIMISSIFNWFGSDFTDGRTLIDYLNQYSFTMITPNAKIEYLDYDWRLNEQ